MSSDASIQVGLSIVNFLEFVAGCVQVCFKPRTTGVKSISNIKIIRMMMKPQKINNGRVAKSPPGKATLFLSLDPNDKTISKSLMSGSSLIAC